MQESAENNHFVTNICFSCFFTHDLLIPTTELSIFKLDKYNL